MPRELVEDIIHLVEPVVEDQGMELVAVDFGAERGGWVLRLFIDGPDGVTLDDCAEVSGCVGAVLDVKEIIDVPYVLEVSSPGVNRPLRKEKDFRRFAGQRIALRTVQSIGGRKNFKGQLMGVQEDNLLLHSVSGQELKIALANVAWAHIDYQWEGAAFGGRAARSRGSRR